MWNFTCGVLYERNENDSFTEIRRWNDTSYIRTRQDVDTYRADWERVIDTILEEINSYYASGRFLPANLGDVVSDTVLSEIIRRNQYLLADQLKAYGLRDVRVRARIQKWWDQVRTEYSSGEANTFIMYARVIIINWTNRILFAHVAKRFHNLARQVESLTYESTPAQADALFESISKTCDFHNIFAPMPYNQILPEDTWRDLMELNEFLSNNAMYSVSQTALQSVLEHTISSGIRELNGQFATPEKLAILLTRIAMRNIAGPCIDPCCGTGTIAKAVLTNKIDNEIPVASAYSTVWASDKFSFPLQIASIGMARVDSINQPIRVFQSDAFALVPGSQIPLIDPATGEPIVCKLPLFDTIVSNLPFVPFEKIDKDELQYIRAVHASVYRDTGINLDNRSDLYQSLIFSLHSLLSRDGRLGVITSNSWLGTKVGRLFYDALSWYYNIEQVHISGNGRWFTNADIVTTILIMSKKLNVCKPDADTATRLYIWEKALPDLDTTDMKAIANDAILNECSHLDQLSSSMYKKEDIDALLEMGVSFNALFYDIHWLKEIKDNLCPITDYLDITRGERRGWDKLFYPSDQHEIEQVYIKKVLKSSKHLTTLCAVPDSDAFCCSESIAELERAGHIGALKWIHAFANEVNKTGKPLPMVLSRPNTYWYEMKDTSTADFVTGMNPDRRLFVAKFDEPAFVNQRLIAFKQIGRSVDADLLHALLNSIVGMFYIEAVGFGRGLGALDINATNIKSIMVLNPKLLSDTDMTRILDAFAPLKQRNVLGTYEELCREDRKNFDSTVLKAFGIDHLYAAMRNTLLSMQRVRHSVRE